MRSYETFMFCVNEHALNAVCLLVEVYLWRRTGMWYHTLETVRTYMAEYCVPEVFLREELFRRRVGMQIQISQERGVDSTIVPIDEDDVENKVVEEIEICLPKTAILDVKSIIVPQTYKDKILEGHAVKQKGTFVKIYKSIRPELYYTKLKMLDDKVEMKRLLFAPKVDGCRAVLTINSDESSAKLVTEADMVYDLKITSPVSAVFEVEIVEDQDSVKGLVIYDILKFGKIDTTLLSLDRRIKVMQGFNLLADFPIYFQKYTDIEKMYENKRYYSSRGIGVDGIVCAHSHKSYMADMYKWKLEETIELMVKIKGDKVVAVLNIDEQDVEIAQLEDKQDYIDGEVYEFKCKKEIVKIRLRPDRVRSNSKVVYDNILLFNKRAKYLSDKYRLHSNIYYGLRKEDSCYEKYIYKK